MSPKILTNNMKGVLPGRGCVHLIDNFVASILHLTDYPAYEVVVVDNSTLSPLQATRFKGLGVEVNNFSGCGDRFNFAAKANYAIACASTEHVVLLNDDMQVISPGHRPRSLSPF